MDYLGNYFTAGGVTPSFTVSGSGQIRLDLAAAGSVQEIDVALRCANGGSYGVTTGGDDQVYSSTSHPDFVANGADITTYVPGSGGPDGCTVGDGSPRDAYVLQVNFLGQGTWSAEVSQQQT